MFCIPEQIRFRPNLRSLEGDTQRPLQVLQEILPVLDTYTQPDKVLGDPRFQPILDGNTAMRHLPRRFSEGFYSTKGFRKSKESQRLKEFFSLSFVGSKSDGDHPAEWNSILADLLVDHMVAIRRIGFEVPSEPPQVLLSLTAQAPLGSFVERTRTQSGISNFADQWVVL